MTRLDDIRETLKRCAINPFSHEAMLESLSLGASDVSYLVDEIDKLQAENARLLEVLEDTWQMVYVNGNPVTMMARLGVALGKEKI